MGAETSDHSGGTVLKAPTDTFRNAAKRAAKAFWRATARRRGQALLLRGMARNAGFQVKGADPLQGEATRCCPPCRKGFARNSAVSTHCHYCHDRCAKYRLCDVGMRCQACGLESYGQLRQSLHLKGCGRYCDVLAAMGLGADVRQEGIKTWKPAPSASLV